MRFGDDFMRTNRTRKFRSILLIGILGLALVIALSMIFLGATTFRSQLPIFQLIDGNGLTAMQVDKAPPVNEGVVDLNEPGGVRLYMILGSDFRPTSGFRTDILMLVAVDSRSGKMSLVSFPRDLWVSIPGYGEQRINTAMQSGGFPLLADTMQTEFGVYPTQYAMIDMAGFLKVIDVFGGIEFTTENYTGDACDSSLDPDMWCEVGPGTVSLNSDWALWYVRARYNSSDFDRMRRTQEVVKAVIDKTISPAGMLKLPELMKIYESEVETNISPDQLIPMARLGLNFNSNEDIRRFTIGPNETTSWSTAGGANVLLPNISAIQAILAEALNFE